MAKVARVFDQHNRPSSMPSPIRPVSNERRVPWVEVRDDEMPPMMFQIWMSNGRIQSYTYNDLHEVHCPDAGCVELYLYSFDKLLITLEGRHLRELAHLFSCACVRSLHEADPRDLDVPERDPEITSISIEVIEEKEG